MNVLIIEDEAPAFRRLSNLLSENHSDIVILEVVDSIADALAWFKQNAMPQLIFSDIQLADGLSFKIYESVEITCPIIFTTAYDEYMLDAFRTTGIDYLLKPIQAEDLARSLIKLNTLNPKHTKTINIEDFITAIDSRTKKYKSRFLIKLGSKLVPVSAGEVAFFSALDGSTKLVTQAEKSYLLDQSLDELEKVLDPDIFFRLNRQYIAHVNSIANIHQYFKGKLKVVLQPLPQQDVVVSREKAKAFKSWLSD